MTSNFEEPLEIHYHDGKPELKKVDLSKEIDKELHEEEKPINYFDSEKSALYADLPKAKQKMDKSINARSINSMLESYNRQRNEAKFDTQRNGHTIIIKVDGYEFKCDDEQGTIITTKVPDKGLKMSLKAPRLKGADIDNFFDEVEKHIERHKTYQRDTKKKTNESLPNKYLKAIEHGPHIKDANGCCAKSRGFCLSLIENGKTVPSNFDGKETIAISLLMQPAFKDISDKAIIKTAKKYFDNIEDDIEVKRY